jgi:hypothetical protein
MQRIVIFRLGLVDKRVFTIGDPWPSELLVPDEFGKPKKVPMPAIIGGIFFVPTETRTNSESWIEEEEDEEDKTKTRMVTYTESGQKQTPAHYEVWAFPNEESILNQIGETRCLRFQREEVAEAEEVWPLGYAQEVVRVRRKAAEMGPEDEPEEGDEEPVTAATAPS